ncbi:ATP-binding cassette domain-containing protein [Enterococcus faecalis]
MVNNIYIKKSIIKISEEKYLEIIEDYSITNGLYKLGGANGSGKSIFLEYVSGLKKNDNIIKKIKHNKILFLGESGIGLEELTVFENIKLVYWIFGAQFNEIVMEKVKMLYTKEQLNTIYSQASFGMQLMVGLSLLFSEIEWELIILDEVLNGLDKDNRLLILANVQKKSNNSIVFLVSHGEIDNTNEYKEVEIIDKKIIFK